jgi:hypothetical protein
MSKTRDDFTIVLLIIVALGVGGAVSGWAKRLPSPPHQDDYRALFVPHVVQR